MADNTVVFKDAELKRLLKRMDTKLSHAKLAKAQYRVAIAGAVFGDIIHHFEQQMGPDGKWQDWSKRYKAYKAKKNPSAKILQDTGRLRGGLIPTNTKAVSGGVLFFNKVPYAAQHDQGIKPYPQRKFMWLSKKGMDTVSKITVGFLLK